MVTEDFSAVQAKFWHIISKFYELNDGFKGTIPDLSAKLNIHLADGFFYSKILPVLTKHNILIYTGEENKKSYLGRYGKVYKLDKNKLDVFVVKHNKLAMNLYKKWVKNFDVETEILD